MHIKDVCLSILVVVITIYIDLAISNSEWSAEPQMPLGKKWAFDSDDLTSKLMGC